ncbi:MAG: type II toxin-antitoxin system PemK/MazF family toxin [Candidatus Diapherotrites archaeon]|nr:type II toxin-antitoxin system PemK/MazF family toxin [Candidatus Diapherotrites archaeon]
MNLSNIEQGEVVVADLFYSNQVGVKRRLALVISSSKYNAHSADVVLAKITSQSGVTFYDVPIANVHMEKKMLAKDSMIMVDFPMTVEKELVVQRLDKLKPEKLAEVKQKLKAFFDL